MRSFFGGADDDVALVVADSTMFNLILLFKIIK